MPTIKKLHCKSTWRKRQRNALYRLPQWRQLSEYVRMCHPLCSICEANSLTQPAEHVHHIRSPFRPGLTNDEKMALLLDPRNLISLCATCHSLIHAGKLAIPPDIMENIISGDYLKC